MKQLAPKFVETMPKEIEEGFLYISMNFHTCSHLCPCGCKRRVVTPLSPVGWTLIFDGKAVSLEPSIGNWSSPCQSHYWIINNCIVSAPAWSSERISRGQLYDQKAIEKYYSDKNQKSNSRKIFESGGKRSKEKKQRNKVDGEKKTKKKNKNKE